MDKALILINEKKKELATLKETNETLKNDKSKESQKYWDLDREIRSLEAEISWHESQISEKKI